MLPNVREGAGIPAEATDAVKQMLRWNSSKAKSEGENNIGGKKKRLLLFLLFLMIAMYI